MKQRNAYIAAGIITFVAGIIALFPARVAYQWFSPPGVAMSGIDGTIWRGSADAAMTGGLYLRNLQWRMQPGALFSGRVGYGIEADTPSGFLNSSVALGAGGSAALTDLTASLSLQSLQQFVGMPGLGGTLNIRLERLELEAGLPVAAAGTVEVANLRAPIINRSSIGGFRAEFFTQESGVVASVEDTDASVDLAGRLSIAADRSYQFVGVVAPKDNTPPDLVEQMRFLGTANERGQYDLRLEGRL